MFEYFPSKHTDRNLIKSDTIIDPKLLNKPFQQRQNLLGSFINRECSTVFTKVRGSATLISSAPAYFVLDNLPSFLALPSSTYLFTAGVEVFCDFT
jgi:hypothetical protein